MIESQTLRQQLEKYVYRALLRRNRDIGFFAYFLYSGSKYIVIGAVPEPISNCFFVCCNSMGLANASCQSQVILSSSLG